jgi:hypothetical protein
VPVSAGFPCIKLIEMKNIKLKDGTVMYVTTRSAEIMIGRGIATDVEEKEEKKTVETKENKVAPKRQTKGKK